MRCGALFGCVLIMACGVSENAARPEFDSYAADARLQVQWSVRTKAGIDYTQLAQLDQETQHQVNQLLGNADGVLTDDVFRDAATRLLRRGTEGDKNIVQQGQGKSSSSEGYTEVVRSLSATRLRNLGQCHEMRKLYAEYSDSAGKSDPKTEALYRAYDVRIAEPLPQPKDAVRNKGYFSIDLAAGQAKFYIFQEASNRSGDEMTEVVIQCRFAEQP